MSIHGIRELEGVSIEPDGTIVIARRAIFSHVTNDPLVEEHLPALGDAVDQAGGPRCGTSAQSAATSATA